MIELTSLLIAGALIAGAATQTFARVITDSMCGKDHTMMKVSRFDLRGSHGALRPLTLRPAGA